MKGFCCRMHEQFHIFLSVDSKRGFLKDFYVKFHENLVLRIKTKFLIINKGDYMYDSLKENDATLSSIDLVKLLEQDRLINPNLRINRSIRNIETNNEKASSFQIQTNLDLD